MKPLLSFLAATLCTQAAAQEMQLSAGKYVWTSDWGCSELTIGGALAYTYDDGCDGSIDYTANNVFLDGTIIRADDAFMVVQSADSTEIQGIFVFNGETPATFIRK